MCELSHVRGVTAAPIRERPALRGWQARPGRLVTCAPRHRFTCPRGPSPCSYKGNKTREARAVSDAPAEDREPRSPHRDVPVPGMASLDGQERPMQGMVAGGLYFSLYQCPGVRSFASSYDRLPADPYRANQYRRFNRLIYRPATGELRADPDPHFYQSAVLNAYNRGDIRKYPPIERETLEHPGFRAAIGAFVDQVLKHDPQRREVAEAGEELDPIYAFMIRTECAPSAPGVYQKAVVPTPEGVHQDGMDYVSITCVARRDVTGGVSSLYYARDDPAPFVQMELPPGFTMLLNDRIIYHHVSKIEAVGGGEGGSRDVLVLTLNRLDGERHVW